jgi:hypothetical protein
MDSSQATHQVSSQASSQASSHSTRKYSASALDRAAIVLIGIYVVSLIAAGIPPNINDPKWPTLILDSLLDRAFLPLIGAALILLANHLDRRSAIISKHRKWVQKFAPLAALGFFLIIPLQGLASYNVSIAANREATQKATNLTRAMSKIRSAQNEAALLAGISEAGIQNFPPSKPLVPTATDKEQILSQLSTEVSRLQYQSQKNSNNLMQGLVLKWLRDGAMAFLYGFGFRSLGKKNEAANNTSVHAHTKTNQRRK